MPLAETVVIFDLDGTLVDSARDLSRALNYVLASEGLPPLNPDMMRHTVGHGAVAMMAKGFEAAGLEFPDGEDRERLRAAFLSHYSAHIADHTVPFEGCLQALEDIKGLGAKLAVCTNKTAILAVELIDRLDLKSHFEVVLGRDSLSEHKPSPAPLLEILKRTDRPHGIMVGDSYTDRDAARGAMMPCALATFGYGAINEPIGPRERLFSHFNDLPGIISALNSTQH